MTDFPQQAEDILTLTIESENAETIGGLLAKLLSSLLVEQEGFDSKRPFGNSDDYEPIFWALSHAGYEPTDLYNAIQSLDRDRPLVEKVMEAGGIGRDEAERLIAAGLVSS